MLGQIKIHLWRHASASGCLVILRVCTLATHQQATHRSHPQLSLKSSALSTSSDVVSVSLVVANTRIVSGCTSKANTKFARLASVTKSSFPSTIPPHEPHGPPRRRAKDSQNSIGKRNRSQQSKSTPLLFSEFHVNCHLPWKFCSCCCCFCFCASCCSLATTNLIFGRACVEASRNPLVNLLFTSACGWCDTVPLLTCAHNQNARQIRPKSNGTTTNQLWVKALWRAGYFACPETCGMDIPWEDCTCKCTEATIGGSNSSEVREKTN